MVISALQCGLVDLLFSIWNNAFMKKNKIDALWSHVHWLGVLSEMGSFTSASERLGVSKAAMSYRISELEQATGVPLVRRTTRSVRLTEAGQQLVDSTRASFADIERSFAGVRDLAGVPRGLLRLTAPVALGRQQIMPLIPEFLSGHGEIRIELELSDHLSSLAKEGFDLAVRHVAAVPDTHVAWRLCRTNSLLVATPGYLKKHGAPMRPEDLAAHHCLYYLRNNASPTWAFEPRTGKGARINVKISGTFAANNSEALREAALGGLGIALVPEFSVQKEISANRVSVVVRDWRPVGAFGDHLFAIRPFSPQVPAAVRAFVAFLRKRFASGFSGG